MNKEIAKIPKPEFLHFHVSAQSPQLQRKAQQQHGIPLDDQVLSGFGTKDDWHLSFNRELPDRVVSLFKNILVAFFHRIFEELLPRA